MNKTAVSIFIIILIVLGGWWLLSSPAEIPSNTSETNPEPINNSDLLSSESNSDSAAKTFNLTAENYQFSETEIRVKKGDTVLINLTSLEGSHDFVIDELEVVTTVVNADQSTSVEFIATETGEFTYYCSVGQHRELGMVGTLIVEE